MCTSATNVQKFRDTAGRAVSLGSDGSIPTGTAPVIYLKDPALSWETNSSGNGNFTRVGGNFTNCEGPGSTESIDTPTGHEASSASLIQRSVFGMEDSTGTQGHTSSSPRFELVMGVDAAEQGHEASVVSLVQLFTVPVAAAEQGHETTGVADLQFLEHNNAPACRTIVICEDRRTIQASKTPNRTTEVF